MLRHLLDTNLCIRVLRDRPDALRDRFNAEADGLCISSIVLYELLTGAAKSARPQQHRQEVERFASRLAVLLFDAEAAAHAADIRATLEQRSRVIGAYDLLIAGHARSRGLTVVTNNLQEFTRVDGLLCEDWEARTPG
jgi:tRNA(fMet)-specific endonuclease VapC